MSNAGKQLLVWGTEFWDLRLKNKVTSKWESLLYAPDIDKSTFVIIKNGNDWWRIIFRNPFCKTDKEYIGFFNYLIDLWVNKDKFKFLGKGRSKNIIEVSNQDEFNKVVEVIKKFLWSQFELVEKTKLDIDEILENRKSKKVA